MMTRVLLFTPNKPHSRPRWDANGRYHRRIQKKWDKRFGVKTEVVLVRLPAAVKNLFRSYL